MKQKKNKNKSRIIIISIVLGLIIIASLSFYFIKNKQVDTKSITQVITVESLISNPSFYNGNIGVSGTVISNDKSNSMFLLGCSDACIKIPVIYNGKLPDAGNEVIVYGEIKSNSGKYYFNASEVKTK